MNRKTMSICKKERKIVKVKKKKNQSINERKNLKIIYGKTKKKNERMTGK